jgi:gamma-glutamyl hercynylcysteine S-oxide hydrolase
MCRLVGWTGDRPRTLRDVLGDEALERFSDLSRVHSHGWGIAYIDSTTGALSAHRSTRTAQDDPDFEAAATDVATNVGLVHLRWASPGFDHTLSDSHPFVRDGWAMIHNGSVGPPDRVDQLLAEGSLLRPAGSTDSERLFLAVLDFVGPGADAHASGEAHAHASGEAHAHASGEAHAHASGKADPERLGADLASAVEQISDRAVAAGLHASSVNSMFLGPAGLHVLNWHDVTKAPSIAVADPDNPAAPPYYDLRHRRDDDLDVIVSSGFVPDALAGARLPNASLLSLGFDGTRHCREVNPQHPLLPTSRD